MSENLNHPTYYGGADNPYEAIKVIEAWGLGFCLGNALKYICRAGKKLGPSSATSTADHAYDVRVAMLKDLKKARWYIEREIQVLER